MEDVSALPQDLRRYAADYSQISPCQEDTEDTGAENNASDWRTDKRICIMPNCELLISIEDNESYLLERDKVQ